MSHQWTMEDFESIYSRFKSSGLSVMDFCSNECIRPKRFYEWRSKLLRKGGFIPIKRNPCCLHLRSARRQFPSRYVRSPIPMASQSA